jgi:hypothetical protein
LLDFHFELLDEFLFHFGIFFDFFAGFFPVRGAATITCLLTYVLVYNVVDFAFVLICDLYFGFFQDAIKPFPATQKGSPLDFII